MFVRDALPEFAQELERQLLQKGRNDLAEQVAELKLLERCRCGDDFCSSFYTLPKPNGAYGEGHECVELEPTAGMIVLDLKHGEIAHVEVIDRCDLQSKLVAALP